MIHERQYHNKAYPKVQEFSRPDTVEERAREWMNAIPVNSHSLAAFARHERARAYREAATKYEPMRDFRINEAELLKMADAEDAAAGGKS